MIVVSRECFVAVDNLTTTYMHYRNVNYAERKEQKKKKKYRLRTMTHDSNLIVDKIDGKVSTSLRRFCSDGAEMFRHVKRLRANLRNLTVVSQSSRSPERKRSREDSF